MSAVNGFPLMLNQEVPLGYGYPAEAFRAEHYAATSGGNGVGSPTALKVHAQPAPDGTIRTNPGGATLKSTYAGQDEQSYHTYFGPRTVSVSPTGSSAGGRTDLVVVQLCDPEHDNHWSYDGEYPIPADVAKDMEFQRIHVLEGRDRTAHLDFPHALLAEINRPPNTTIVEPSHITDLRMLANPKTLMVPLVKNIGSADTHVAGRTGNYNTLAEFQVDVPEWATTAVVDATLAGCFTRHPNGGVVGNFDFSGLGSAAGGEGGFTQTGWGAAGSVAYERIDFHAGGEVLIDPERRGTNQRINLRVRIPTSAPAGSEAGTEPQSLAKLNVTFQQGVL